MKTKPKPAAAKAPPRRDPLSQRCNSIEESITLALTDKVAQLKAKGVDVVSFGAGEPDFDTPAHIKQAANDALAKGMTKYTSSSGILALRKAVAAKLQKENGLSYDPQTQILICAGGKQAIFNVIQAMLDPGDECLLAAPYWVSYPEMVKTAGAVPVIVPTREAEGFKMTPRALDKAITRRTKLFIHCSPSNPTGIVYSEDEQRALARVFVDRGVHVLSDEVYEKLVYGDAKHFSIAQASPEAKDLTIVVNSFSKSYAMTGWRMGYAAGPASIIGGSAKIQSQSTSNPNSITQYACITALEGDQSAIGMMRAEYEKRRDTIVQRLNAIPGISCIKPDGAFYAFPRVDRLFGKKHSGRVVSDANVLAEMLLDIARVLVVPGPGFGAPEYVRLSYATSMKVILEGLDRIEKFVRELV